MERLLSAILNKCPFLGKSGQVVSHFRKLTGIDIAVCLQSAIDEKAANLYDFFSAGETDKH